MNTIRARAPGVLPAVLSLAARVMALALLATPARSQVGKVSSPAAREQERIALYNDGLALAEAERWEEALRKFQGVVAIRSAPRALVALATAEEKTGRLTSAKRTYLKTQADARGTGEVELVQRATSALTTLQSLIPRVVLRLPPGAADAAVTLDGAPVSPSPQGIEVDPGEHRVVVNAVGRSPFEQTFQISQGQSKDIFVESKTVAAARPATKFEGPGPVASSTDRAADRKLGPPLPVWILGGAGLAAVTVGLVIRANGLSDYEDAKQGCVDYVCTSNETVSGGNAALERVRVGYILAGVGGLSIAGAGAWWVSSATTSPPAPASNAWSVRAHVSADGGSVRFSRAF